MDQETKDRAVRMVAQYLAETGSRPGQAYEHVAGLLDLSVETLRRWWFAAKRENRDLEPAPVDEQEELKRLRREVRELRRANEILKAASAFFAAEIDRPHRF